MDELSARNITLSFGDRVILDNINLSLTKGGLYVLLGENGAGKTTLLRILAGLIPPDSGNIYINGEDTSNFSRRTFAQKAGYLPEGGAIPSDCEVIEAVKLGRTAYGGIFSFPTKEDTEWAERAIKEVGIEEFSHRLTSSLSSGELQLTALAKVLCQNTPILLLDEPTSHLDFKNTHMVLNKIKELAHKSGRTVLITLHDPNIALNYCDRITAISGGVILDMADRHESDFLEKTDKMLKTLYGDGVSAVPTEKGIFVTYEEGC